MMRKVYLIFFSVVLLAGLIVVSTPVAAQQKVALVSLQSALNQVNQGKRAKATLKADFDSKQKQLESMKGDLKKMRDQLEKQKMVLSENALKTKAGEMQSKFMDLQNKAVQYERELKTKEAESADKILQNLKNVVIEIAKKNSYDIVYENSADVVLYSAQGINITNDVIKAFNKKYK